MLTKAIAIVDDEADLVNLFSEALQLDGFKVCGFTDPLNYIFRIPSGYISDKIGKRKILVIIGYGISTISKPLFIFVTTFADTITVRIVDRIGKGIRTAPRDALIADSVDESNTGKAFGIHRT